MPLSYGVEHSPSLLQQPSNVLPLLLLMADLGCQFDTPGKGELHLKNYLHQTELWASLGDKFLIDNRCEEVQPRMGSTIPGQEGLSYKKDS